MSEQELEREWRIRFVRVDQEFGVSVPARWTVELEAYHGQPPTPGGLLMEVAETGDPE